MTEQEMRDAGRICEKDYFSDEDLEIASKALILVIEFLRSRGPAWALAIRPLSTDLRRIEGFQRQRSNRK